MRDMGELAMYFFNLENGRTESENEQKCQKKKKNWMLNWKTNN